MTEPLFWLGLSILLVAVSLTAVLMAALPAFQELTRAARSAEKLFDTLNRELPPTLEAIRLTGIELTNLTDDVGQNVQAAGRVVGQIDQSITGVKQQARQAQVATRSVAIGLKAAWQAFRRSDLLSSDPSPPFPPSQPQKTSKPLASEPRLTASNARRFQVDSSLTEDFFDDEELLNAEVPTPYPEQEQRLTTESHSAQEISS